MQLTDGLLLAGAALGAGLLNAIAGGGSFLTFPALVFAGLPPIAANATSAVAVSPGYFGSVLGFRDELARLPRARLRREALICAVGGVAGALLLLVTPAQVFSAVVPWLLLFATVLFALGPRLLAVRQRRAAATAGPTPPADAPSAARTLGLLAVAIYGGYFNGGLGILLMALYALVGEASIHTANALKNLNSLLLSLLSVVAFACLWPMGVLTQAAVLQVEPRLLEVAQALQLSSWQRFVWIVGPAIVPRLFVALRLGVAIALVVAVTVEIAANPHGMGYALIIAQQSLDPALMLAWLGWVGAVGFAINAGALALQRTVARRMGAGGESGA